MKSLSPAEQSKPRSRRLRKKLCVGEFQQFGLAIEATLTDPSVDNDPLIDAWLDFIEARDWNFGGGIRDGTLSGFLCADGRDSLTQADEALVRDWFEGHPQVVGVTRCDLKDAWHGW